MLKPLLFFFTLSIVSMISPMSPNPNTPDAAELTIALQKLNVLGSVLYIGAHPDDENIGLLTYFSKGRKYRSAYLSLTRGEGGQNLIGPEQGAEIGIIRTQELLAARRIDGAEQYFTRAVDFGYSKTAEESFRFWGRETILADMVWVIRRFQPDVIITRFSDEGMGGHGHHTASTSLTREAFAAAADPNRFPEQLRHVAPWQTKRLAWNSYRRSPSEPAAPLKLDTGVFDPLLGKSYAELAGPIRSLHKSQGFGSAGRRGSQLEQFEVIAGEPSQLDLFTGIDTSWKRIPRGEALSNRLQRVIDTFQPSAPEKSIRGLLEALDLLLGLPESPWVNRKREELAAVIRACTGLWLEAIAAEYAATPGDLLQLKTTFINRTPTPIRLLRLRYPNLAPETQMERNLPANEPQVVETQLTIPPVFPLSQPYWLIQPPTRGLTSSVDPLDIGLAEKPSPLTILADVEIFGRTLTYPIPILYRWIDPVAGEQFRQVEIRPPLTSTFASPVQVLNRQKPSPISVRIKSHSANASGIVRLAAPSGWTIDPGFLSVQLQGKYQETSVEFRVSPPKTSTEAILRVEIESRGQVHNRSLVEIAYPHIRRQAYFPVSELKAAVLDVRNAARKIGYIMGAGDEVAEATRHLGCEVVLLTDDMLDNGDLASFDAIITGVRAFNTRERLRLARESLLRYVENGGTLVVQYNVTSAQPLPLITPFPLTPGRDRVCEEQAPITIIQPNHPLLQFPNRITAEDFSGWIQERGLYFPSQWDPRYQTMLSTHDSGEPDRLGGLLYAEYGKGFYIHTSLSWFRQLPAGIPGAFRIWANIISAGQRHEAVNSGR